MMERITGVRMPNYSGNRINTMRTQEETSSIPNMDLKLFYGSTVIVLLLLIILVFSMRPKFFGFSSHEEKFSSLFLYDTDSPSCKATTIVITKNDDEFFDNYYNKYCHPWL